MTISTAISKFDQSEQDVFSSHVVVLEPLGLLARKHQDLLGTWSKIIHHCISDAGPSASNRVERRYEINTSTCNIKNAISNGQAASLNLNYEY